MEASRYFLETTRFGAKTLNTERPLQEVGFLEKSRDNLETARFGTQIAPFPLMLGEKGGEGLLRCIIFCLSHPICPDQTIPWILPEALPCQPYSLLAHRGAECKEILYRSFAFFSIFESLELVLKHFLCKLCTLALTLASDNYCFVSSVKIDFRFISNKIWKLYLPTPNVITVNILLCFLHFYFLYISVYIVINITWLLFLFLFAFRAHLLHMEVPSLGVELELQLPAFATASQFVTAEPQWEILCVVVGLFFGFLHKCSHMKHTILWYIFFT